MVGMPWLPKRALTLPNNSTQHCLRGTRMNDASVVQGRSPVTAPARPSAHRKVEGQCPPI